MSLSERAGWVTWKQMVSGPDVLRPEGVLAAYPAGTGGLPDLLGFRSVVACVVGARPPLPGPLLSEAAGLATCGVGGEGAAVQAGAADH